jgi:hypothetical protein
MVLEYLEGRTLREWMAQRDPASGPVSPSLAVELLLPVVRALSCAYPRSEQALGDQRHGAAAG